MIGNRTRVKVVKNKMAPPFKEVEFDILYGEGIATRATSSTSAPSATSSRSRAPGSRSSGERIGQGRENAKQFLSDHPEVARKIEAKVLAHHGISRDRGRAGAARASGWGAANGGGATVMPSARSRSPSPRSAPMTYRPELNPGPPGRHQALSEAGVRYCERGLPTRRPLSSRAARAIRVSDLFQYVSRIRSRQWPPRRPPPKGPVEVPEIISILPLRNSVLFPGSIIPIDVGREEVGEARRGGDLQGAPGHRDRDPARRPHGGARPERPVLGRLRGAHPQGDQARQGQLLRHPAGGLAHPAARGQRAGPVHDRPGAAAARPARRPTSSSTRWS